jgi:YHS domain-containing protein
LKVMCSKCGKILDLMSSRSYAFVDEDGKLNAYYFCSDEHLTEFSQKKNLKINTE